MIYQFVSAEAATDTGFRGEKMKISNLENETRKFIAGKGPFKVLEYEIDASVSPALAEAEYFMSKMNVRRRQVIASLNGKNRIIAQAGAMQWMSGSVRLTSGIKGVGDLFGKMVKGAVTKESAVKPEYEGVGILALEPTYKYLLLEDVEEWSSGMTIEDGMFLACEDTVKSSVVHRKSASSTVLGGEGFFNLSLSGRGIAVLESNVPGSELISIDLENEELRIDGNLAVCWSSGLDFTVERSGKTLMGSAISGEGLVNVYRGTGRVLMAPVTPTTSLTAATHTVDAKAAAKNSNTFGK